MRRGDEERRPLPPRAGQAGGSSPAEKEGVEKKAGDGALLTSDRRRELWRIPSPQRDAVGPWGHGQMIGRFAGGRAAMGAANGKPFASPFREQARSWKALEDKLQREAEGKGN